MADRDSPSSSPPPPLPLRHATIHRLQRSFYEEAGQRGGAWGVPTWITSNAAVAQSYATFMLHAWRDCLTAGRLDLREPLYVVELGAGSGSFTALLLHELLTRMGRLLSAPGAPPPRLLYIVTDFTPSMYGLWDAIPALARAMRAGVLDYSVLDVTAWQGGGEPTLLLHHSRAVLRAGSFVNPVHVTANYVLDSLPLDAWRVERVARHEEEGGGRGGGVGLLVELTLAANGVLAWYERHGLHASLRPEEVAREVESPGLPPPPLVEDDGRTGEEARDSSTFTLPIGSLACVDMLRRLCCPAGCLLLICDKGFALPGAYVGGAPPDIHAHGSFSCMVNFHALHVWARLVGEGAGAPTRPTVLPSRDDDVHVRVEVILLPAEGGGKEGGQPFLHPSNLPTAVDTLARLQSFGPSELWDVYNALGKEEEEEEEEAEGEEEEEEEEEGHGEGEEHTEVCLGAVDTPSRDGGGRAGGTLSSRAAVSLCRLAAWDAGVYASVRGVIARGLHRMTAPRQAQVLAGLMTMKERMYPPWGEKDEEEEEGMGGAGAADGGAGRMDSAAALARAGGVDVDFELGRVSHLCGHYRTALSHYLDSHKRMGGTRETLFNIGTCCVCMGQHRHALLWFTRAAGVAGEGGGAEQARLWAARCERLVAQAEAERGDGTAACDAQPDGRVPSPRQAVKLPSGRRVVGMADL